jgi:hypothetical protein
MTMFSSVQIVCPGCDELIEQDVSVPDPSFAADKMKDSGVEFFESIVCEHCEREVNYWGSNNFYEIHLQSDEVDDDDFIYSQPEYDFTEYEVDDDLESEGVASILKGRGVKALYHFTKIENVGGISKQGLVPRSKLAHDEFAYTDYHRADGFLDANCVTVSFPQYRMFFVKRSEDKKKEWVVFEISPELLPGKDCAYFERNAASRQVKTEIIDNRKLATAFEKMFDELDDFPSREETGISDSYPTDPQAEILVFDRVEPSYIVAAHFESEGGLKKHEHLLNGIKACVTPELFNNREDHDFL